MCEYLWYRFNIMGAHIQEELLHKQISLFIYASIDSLLKVWLTSRPVYGSLGWAWPLKMTSKTSNVFLLPFLLLNAGLFSTRHWKGTNPAVGLNYPRKCLDFTQQWVKTTDYFGFKQPSWVKNKLRKNALLQ